MIKTNPKRMVLRGKLTLTKATGALETWLAAKAA
jgi:hypothetical protein